jgi:MATE family multidrug resistance protein
MQVMTLMNVAMVGRSSAEGLAAFSVALAPYFTVILISLCLVGGIQPYVASAIGANDRRLLHTVLRTAVGLSSAIALAATLACLICAGGFGLTSMPADLAHRSAATMAWLALGMPALVLHFGLSSVFEGLQQPRINVVCLVAGLIANFLLNLFLIDFALGPPSAAIGAAIAMSITRWLMLGILVFAAWRRWRSVPGRIVEGQFQKSTLVQLLKFGVPLAAAYGAKSAALAAIVMIVAVAGERQVSALQLVLNINLLITMLANGLSTVAAIRVATFSGATRHGDMQRAMSVALVCFCGLIAPPLLMLVLLPQAVFGLFAGNVILISAVSAAAPLAATLCLLDGMATVAIGILRGFKDGWFAPTVVALSFGTVALPGAMLLVRESNDFTAALWALVVSFSIALPLIALRVSRVSVKAGIGVI